MAFNPLPSRSGLALWWGMFWRNILWTLAFLIPFMAFIFALAFILSVTMMMSGIEKESAKTMIEIVMFPINNFLWPFLLMSWVFYRLFRKGAFGKYAISATYKGQPVKTFKQSIKFTAFTWLEIFKYAWPYLIAGLCIGLAMGLGVLSAASFTPAFLITCLAIMIYTHILVLTDLIHRRSYNRCQLVVEKQKSTVV